MNILLICGSDRKGSLNMQLAKMAEKDLEERVNVSILNYADLPIFSQDLEYPAPESITCIRAEVAKADVLWFFCPEYNGNMTPMLVNLVDWLSRPESPQASFRDSLLNGKLFTISGIGGRGGTASAQTHLEAMLKFLGMIGFTELDTRLKMNADILKSSSLASFSEAGEEIEKQARGYLAFIQQYLRTKEGD